MAVLNSIDFQCASARWPASQENAIVPAEEDEKPSRADPKARKKVVLTCVFCKKTSQARTVLGLRLLHDMCG